MFAVVSCKKYHPRTLRVVEIGNSDPLELFKKMKNMECRLCGPCSHVELSWEGWLESHGIYKTDQEAIEASKLLSFEYPNKFDNPFLSRDEREHERELERELSDISNIMADPVHQANDE